MTPQTYPNVPGNPDGTLNGHIIGLFATFKITAPNGTVTGVKYAPPVRDITPVAGSPISGPQFANCLPAGSTVVSSQTFHVYQAAANVNYAAVIRTPTGQSFADHGTSNLVVDDEAGTFYGGRGPNAYNPFYEDFASSQTTTTPLGGDGGRDNAG